MPKSQSRKKEGKIGGLADFFVGTQDFCILGTEEAFQMDNLATKTHVATQKQT